ncbi:MAG: hypothetical protein OEZ39_00660 [Gammaproteobacteria bacterium]|nr:hypothetical protein [Gammaproteobacteria bacterium]MDH5650360.1 hypothetical protein [Gammaproteobacteria bacterium]
MESLVALVGVMFFVFLVLATAVEVILETFRGILEWCGFTWAKGKVSLEEALSMAGEFTDGNTLLAAKIQAVETAARQVEKEGGEKLTQLDQLGRDLAATGKTSEEIALRLNKIAVSVKERIDISERHRIYILRVITALIGMVLVWKTEFYVFDILAQSPDAKQYLGTLMKVQAPWVNILVGGFAAAAGSAYWHDKLDKVRKLKVVAKDIRQLKS